MSMKIKVKEIVEFNAQALCLAVGKRPQSLLSDEIFRGLSKFHGEIFCLREKSEAEDYCLSEALYNSTIDY